MDFSGSKIAVIERVFRWIQSTIVIHEFLLTADINLFSPLLNLQQTHECRLKSAFDTLTRGSACLVSEVTSTHFYTGPYKVKIS